MSTSTRSYLFVFSPTQSDPLVLSKEQERRFDAGEMALPHFPDGCAHCASILLERRDSRPVRVKDCYLWRTPVREDGKRDVEASIADFEARCATLRSVDPFQAIAIQHEEREKETWKPTVAEWNGFGEAIKKRFGSDLLQGPESYDISVA